MREKRRVREREGRGTEEAVLTASQSCVRAAEGKGALQQRLLTEQTHVDAEVAERLGKK